MTGQLLDNLIAHHVANAERWTKTAQAMASYNSTTSGAALVQANFHREAADGLRELRESFQLFNHTALGG